MKKSGFLVLLILVPLFSGFAQQKETFDLATFTVPDGSKRVSNSAEVVSHAVSNKQDGACDLDERMGGPGKRCAL